MSFLRWWRRKRQVGAELDAPPTTVSGAGEERTAARRREDLDRFYALLERLRQTVGGFRLLRDCTGQSGWPDQGVYFFFEPREIRTNGRALRVVRIGTHGVAQGSNSTLWQRLAQHQGSTRGAHAGGGNHRGSVFRRHVGLALLNRNPGQYPVSLRQSWLGARPSDAVAQAIEHALECEVSGVIRGMPLLWLDVPGPSGPRSRRRYIEINSIALVSNWGKDGPDLPSAGWLGRWADDPRIEDPRIAESGLWNLDGVDSTYEPAFLDILSECIDAMAGLKAASRAANAVPPAPKPATSAARPASCTLSSPPVSTPAPNPRAALSASIGDLNRGPSGSGNAPPQTLVIVPCSGQKFWRAHPDAGPLPARQAYTGPVFRASVGVAKAMGAPWVILSAKYGFLLPEEAIEDYDVTFNDPRTGPVDPTTLRRQVPQKGLDRYTHVVALGGTNYVSRVKEAFRGTGIVVEAPVAGLRIGRMLQGLHEIAASTVPNGGTTLAADARPATGRRPPATIPSPDAGLPRAPSRMPPDAARFRTVLAHLLGAATTRREPWIDIRAGDLHRLVGGYPGTQHRMPVCCSVMRASMRTGDTIIRQPPSGRGASLVIRYRLPRP